MKKYICLYLFFLFPCFVCKASSPEDVIFLNTGKIYVAPNEISGTSLYIPDGMRVLSDMVKIVLNGTAEVGGNFYQDSRTNVFDIDSEGITTSTGTFSFVSTRAVRRVINTQTEDINTFDRASYYVAFPKIRIETDDTVCISPKMGIDASGIHLGAGKAGFLYLCSDTCTVGLGVYNASLRIPTTGFSSEELVDLGSVIFEQKMKTYRTGTQLFAFATPFKNTQLAGYFAGNWVRKPETGTFLHTTYVLGNKPATSGSSQIHSDQYVTDAISVLQPGQAYLIKPRPNGFNYSDLQSTGGLAITGALAGAYDLDKFVFNGRVYTIAPYKEQLFAEDILFSYTFQDATDLSGTVNWLIGNSYTCPISTQLLAEQMLNSGLIFAPYVYVFPTGSTSYQPLDISGDGDAITLTDIDEVPSTSIFMIRLSRNQTGTIPANTTFEVGKNLLRHGNISHNLLRSSKSTANNQVIFKITPVNNGNIYDLAAIGIRENASLESDTYDISKIYTSAPEGFQLYTLSGSGSKLSVNGVPTDVETVRMGLKPALAASSYKLKALYTESLTTEGIWLEDILTGEKIDLAENPEYTFSSNPSDSEVRFIVRFKNAFTTINQNDQEENNSLNIFYSNRQVTINNLLSTDINSKIYVYDVLGKTIRTFAVNEYPAMTFPADFPDGTYIVYLEGNRNISLKFIKSDLN